jgi:2'-5' RNA ligase
MRRLAVVSYPTLAGADSEWIESIRANHDPQADKLAAHFTLVFPFDVGSGDVASEIAAVASLTQAIPFIIRRARAVPDVVNAGAHVFLIPDEGRDQIVALHDRLYSGLLRPHLRDDITFEPHITVAAGLDVGWCKAIADGLNRAPRAVAGLVESLELVEIGFGTVSSMNRFILGNA